MQSWTMRKREDWIHWLVALPWGASAGRSLYLLFASEPSSPTGSLLLDFLFGGVLLMVLWALIIGIVKLMDRWTGA